MTNTYDKELNTKVSFLFPRVLTERMDELSVRIGVSRSQLLRKSTQEYLNFLENEYQRNNSQMVQCPSGEEIPVFHHSTSYINVT